MDFESTDIHTLLTTYRDNTDRPADYLVLEPEPLLSPGAAARPGAGRKTAADVRLLGTQLVDYLDRIGLT